MRCGSNAGLISKDGGSVTRRYLERESQATSGHAEVVIRSMENVPAEVVHPSNMTVARDDAPDEKNRDRF